VDMNRPRDLVLFALIAGFVLYLGGAVWSGLFVVTLPQDRDWCKDVIAVRESETNVARRCVAFKNSFEELKYYYNLEAVESNRYRLVAQLLVGGLLGWLFFHRLPKMRAGLPKPNESLVASFFIGTTVALVMPLLWSWVLPPGATWLPRQITERADHRVAQELNLLRKIASDMDAEKR